MGIFKKIMWYLNGIIECPKCGNELIYTKGKYIHAFEADRVYCDYNFTTKYYKGD